MARCSSLASPFRSRTFSSLRASPLLLFALLWSIGPPLDAQDEFEMRFREDRFATPGSVVTMTTELDVIAGEGSAGLSYEVCHDFNVVQPVAAKTNDDLTTVNLGSPPDFEAIAFLAGTPTLPGGVTHGVLVCLESCAVIPIGTTGLLDIEYEVVGAPGTSSMISICEEAELPPQQPAEIVVTNKFGQTIEPTLVPGEITVVPDVAFRRGDVNDDGGMNIADIVAIGVYLFDGGEEPGCLDAADTNDDGVIDVADAVRLVRFLFQLGPPLPAPMNSCGTDPTDDTLICVTAGSC